MKSRMKTENIIRIRPVIAAVISCFPAFTLSGFAPEARIINPDMTINRKLIPPPTPNAQRSMKVRSWFVSSIGTQPIAELTPYLPGA